MAVVLLPTPPFRVGHRDGRIAPPPPLLRSSRRTGAPKPGRAVQIYGRDKPRVSFHSVPRYRTLGPVNPGLRAPPRLLVSVPSHWAASSLGSLVPLDFMALVSKLSSRLLRHAANRSADQAGKGPLWFPGVPGELETIHRLLGKPR